MSVFELAWWPGNQPTTTTTTVRGGSTEHNPNKIPNMSTSREDSPQIHLAGAVVEVELSVRNDKGVVFGQGELEDSPEDGAEQDGGKGTSGGDLFHGRKRERGGQST